MKTELKLLKRNHDSEVNDLKQNIYVSMTDYLRTKARKVTTMMTEEHSTLIGQFIAFKKRTQRQLDEVKGILARC